MATILTPQTNMPFIVSTGGLQQHGASVMVPTSTSDTHLHGIWPGMFVVASTNGYIAVKGTETISGDSTSFASADYVVNAIRDAQGQKLPVQYVTTTQLGAAAYILEVIPIGSVEFYITEDGDTTPITNADSGGVAARYCNVVITEPSSSLNPVTGYNPITTTWGKFLLDSSSVTGTAGSTSMQLLGVASIPQNAYSATAGSQRVFKAKVRSAGQSQ